MERVASKEVQTVSEATLDIHVHYHESTSIAHCSRERGWPSQLRYSSDDTRRKT